MADIVTTLDALHDGLNRELDKRGIKHYMLGHMAPDDAGRYVLVHYMPTGTSHVGYNGHGGVHSGVGWLYIYCLTPLNEGERETYRLAQEVSECVRAAQSPCYTMSYIGPDTASIDGGHYNVRVRAQIRYYEDV